MVSFASTKILLLLTFIIVCFIKTSKTKRTVAIDKFLTKCPDYHEIPYLTVSNQKIFFRNKNVVINYQFNVTSDMPKNEKIKLTLAIERCRGKESLDNCVKFTKFSTYRACAMIEQKNEFWSPLLSCITPEWKCPIKKVLYVATNCTLNMDLFNWFPVDNYYWRAKVHIMDEDKHKEMFCGVLELATKIIR